MEHIKNLVDSICFQMFTREKAYKFLPEYMNPMSLEYESLKEKIEMEQQQGYFHIALLFEGFIAEATIEQVNETISVILKLAYNYNRKNVLEQFRKLRHLGSLESIQSCNVKFLIASNIASIFTPYKIGTFDQSMGYLKNKKVREYILSNYDEDSEKFDPIPYLEQNKELYSDDETFQHDYWICIGYTSQIANFARGTVEMTDCVIC